LERTAGECGGKIATATAIIYFLVVSWIVKVRKQEMGTSNKISLFFLSVGPFGSPWLMNAYAGVNLHVLLTL
jgi:hypothetical protein